MEPEKIIVECSTQGFWLFTLFKTVLFPLFLSYLAAAAYAFQRRRADIATVHEAIKDMHHITRLALAKESGSNPDIENVREVVFHLVSRVKLEMLHRPEYIQKMIEKILGDFLMTADVAIGRTPGNVIEMIDRMTIAENSLIHLVHELTVFEAIKQAWINPGLGVDFDALLNRFKGS
jgi:hypothetical protein